MVKAFQAEGRARAKAWRWEYEGQQGDWWLKLSEVRAEAGEGNLDAMGKTEFYTERSREPRAGSQWRRDVDGFSFNRLSLWGMDLSGGAKERVWLLP